jgi:hypothetical protein
VSLHWNNAQIGNAVIPSFNMSNGKFHRVQVVVWFSNNNAYVTLRLTPNIHDDPGQTETVLQSVFIPGVAPYQSRVAFGARTGGAWAAHDLDNIDVQFNSYSGAAAGLSMLLLPAGEFGNSGPGSTLGNFTDAPLVPGTLAVDIAFNPSNLVNDLSLYWDGVRAGAVNLPAQALVLDNDKFHHVRLQLDRVDEGAYATLTLTPDSLGNPLPPLNVFSNWFIPGVSLASSRLEFAGRNGGLRTKLDLDNVVTRYDRLVPILLAPGETILVVHNAQAFISRYGSGPRIAGEFSGSLSDAGEKLVLTGPLGEPILDFNYSPAWYPITDGGGYSLEVVRTDADPGAWDSQDNWRASARPGGSPGTVDSLPSGIDLSISIISGQFLRLAWPSGEGNSSLWSTPALDRSSAWTQVTNLPVLISNRWVITLPLTNTAAFYRLLATP